MSCVFTVKWSFNKPWSSLSRHNCTGRRAGSGWRWWQWIKKGPLTQTKRNDQTNMLGHSFRQVKWSYKSMSEALVCLSVSLSAAGFPFDLPCFRLLSSTFQMILEIPLLFFMIVIIARPLHPCSHSSWENVTLDWNYRRENSCWLHSASVWDFIPLRVIKLIFSLIVCRQISNLLKANKSSTSCFSRQPELVEFVYCTHTLLRQ